MRNRTVTAIFLALFLTVGFTALWSAEGDEADGDTATNIVASNEGASAQPKKKGSRWGRIFKAPFKAVGKVFGAGGDDDKHLARISEEDARRFESVGVERVEYKDGTKAEEAPPGSAEDYLERGRAELEGGDLNAAIENLSRAASLDPRLSQAHSLLALAYDRKGLHDRARDSYEHAIDVNEHDPQTLNNLGYSLYLNGNYRAAVDKLKKAAKLAPADTRILNNLALAQCRLGKYDDAYKNFARAGGELDGHMNVAALLERTGRDDEAIKHLEAARRIQPGSADIVRRLAGLYERNGRTIDAQSARRDLDALENGNAVVAGGGR
jgi:Flp pilus assembly protein TadD